MYKAFLLLAALVLAPALPAKEIRISTMDPGGADAHIYADTPDRNFGEADMLVTKAFGHQPEGSRKTYLRFPLAELGSAPAIESLELRLLLVEGAPDQEVVFNVYILPGDTIAEGEILGSDWDEIGLTWQNAPGNNRTRGDIADGHNEGRRIDTAVLFGRLTSSDPSPGSEVSWQFPTHRIPDLTNIIADLTAQHGEMAGLTVILTRLTSDSKLNTSFASKEYSGTFGGYPPTLVVGLQE